MKPVFTKYWQWLIVGASAFFVPWVYFLFVGVFQTNLRYFVLIVLLVFLGLSFCVFRLLHLTFSLVNILLLDLAYLSLILAACKATIRHQVWITALAILLILLASFTFHRFYKGEINFHTKRTFVVLAVAALLCYNCFYAIKNEWQRKSGDSSVQASYLYTATKEDKAPKAITFQQSKSRLNTPQDLNNYVQFYCEYLELDKEHSGFPSFLEISKKYDNAYFQNSSLEVITMGVDSSSIRYQIEEFNLQSKSLFSTAGLGIYFRKYIPATLSEEKLTCLALLQLPKSGNIGSAEQGTIQEIKVLVTDAFIPQFDLKNHTKDGGFTP